MKYWAARGVVPGERPSPSLLSGHAGGGGQYPVGADEIAAMPDGLVRQPHRLVVIASYELGVGSDAVIDRRQQIARAQPQRALCSQVGVFPAADIRQCQAIVTLGQREVRVESSANTNSASESSKRRLNK